MATGPAPAGTVGESRIPRRARFATGSLIATGVPGVYGRSAEFEDTGSARRPAGRRPRRRRHAEVMRFPPVLNRDRSSSGADSSSRSLTSPARFTASPATNGRIASCIRAVEARQGLERGTFLPPQVVLTPAACYPVYPLLSGTLPAAGRLVDVMSYCFRHEPSDDPGRMQMFRMHEHVRADRCRDRDGVARDVARPGRWRRRRASVSRRAAGRGLRPVLRPRRNAARGKPARPAPQARDRGAYRQRGLGRPPSSRSTIIRITSAQLFGITTADGAVAHTRLRRFRAGAHDAGALPPPRLRPCAVAVAGTRRRWSCDCVASGPLRRRRPTRVMRFTSGTAPGPNRTATSISGSNCSTLPATSRWQRCPSRSPSTSRAISGRSSSSRSPISQPLWRRRHRTERVAAARQFISKSSWPCSGRRHRGSRCVLPARHRGHELSRRARQDVDRRPGARRARPPSRLLPQRRLLRARGQQISPASSASTRAPIRPPAALRGGRQVGRQVRPPAGARSSTPRSTLLRTHSPGARAATRFAATPSAFPPTSNGWPAQPHRTLSQLRLRHAAPVRRGVRARRRRISRWLEASANAGSTSAAGLRRHRHHGQDAAVQDGARRQRRTAVRSRADRSTTMAEAWDETMTALAARYGALAHHG